MCGDQLPVVPSEAGGGAGWSVKCPSDSWPSSEPRLVRQGRKTDPPSVELAARGL